MPALDLDPSSTNPFLDVFLCSSGIVSSSMDSLGIEHAAKVEVESLFEAAVLSLHRLDSSFLDGGGRMGPEKVARQE